ncbi:MAG: hypothetical protein DHS20C14_22280 [Phycisphaeraceae bacterium]|nr:MAG: hypothetical protein DHS20C14_22280 [Phycisphaeraceae bacterium]
MGMIATRHGRIGLLIVLIAVLSAIDLYLTLLYTSTTGMAEANPLARALLHSGSPVDVALWKTATVGMCVGLLWLSRRARVGELGAWVAVALLAWLMVHWVTFARETHQMVTIANAVNYDFQSELDPRWVQFEPEHLEAAPAWARVIP